MDRVPKLLPALDRRPIQVVDHVPGRQSGGGPRWGDRHSAGLDPDATTASATGRQARDRVEGPALAGDAFILPRGVLFS